MTTVGCASQPTSLRPSAARLPPKPVAKPQSTVNARSAPLSADRHCMALNLYWEARGEGRRGMYAVGWTVLNRVNSPQFPSSVCGVVKQGGETPPCQFSWWCDGRSDRPRERQSWTTAVAVSAELLKSPPPDPTGGALFYHNTSIASPWLRSRQRTAQIGRHIFYR